VRTRVSSPLFLLVLAIALVSTSCGSTGAGQQTRPSSTGPTGNGKTPSGYTWIISKSVFDGLVADPTAAARLRGDKVYELLHGSQTPTPGFPVIPTLDFTSFAAMQQAFESGSVPSFVKAVLYDSEHWAFTPTGEQADPAGYYRQAAQLAHAHGLLLIATPAIDLVATSQPGSTDQPQAYLDEHLAAAAASGDIVEIQAQRLVNDLPQFTSFVSAAAAQARATHPGVTLLAGLSTCAGDFPSASQLVAAAEASKPFVAGWWLNVPGASAESPNCSTQRLSTAISFLDDLPAS